MDDDVTIDRIATRAAEIVLARLDAREVSITFGNPVVTKPEHPSEVDRAGRASTAIARMGVTERVERLRALIRAYRARFGPIENLDALQPGDLE